MTVETKNVAHGTYAVQFHGPATPAPKTTSTYHQERPAALAKHNFGRAYMYLSRSATTRTWASSSAHRGISKPDLHVRRLTTARGWQFGFIKLSGSLGEVQAQPKGDIPVMKWSCLEWEFNDDRTRSTYGATGTSSAR